MSRLRALRRRVVAELTTREELAYLPVLLPVTVVLVVYLIQAHGPLHAASIAVAVVARALYRRGGRSAR
jgi:hypothetical protein